MLELRSVPSASTPCKVAGSACVACSSSVLQKSDLNEP